MSHAELRAPVLKAMQSLLRPIGYRKTAGLFVRELNDVLHLIDLQASRYSSSSEVQVTVNVAVFVSALVNPDVRDVTRPSIAGAHWRQRLGSLSPEQKDLWWNVATFAQAESAAGDIVRRLEQYALPALSSVPDQAALVALWKSGRSPGMTEYQRTKFLAQLSS